MLWKTLISFESLKFKLIKFKCMYQMMLICDVCLLKFKLNPVSISKWLKLFTLKSPIYFDCLKMVIQISICLVCKLQNVNTSRQYKLHSAPYRHYSIKIPNANGKTERIPQAQHEIYCPKWFICPKSPSHTSKFI